MSVHHLVSSARSAVQQVHRGVYALLLGLALGGGGLVLSGACPAGGQCAQCGSCLVGLPLAALVLVAIRRQRRLPQAAQDAMDDRILDVEEERS